MPENPSAHPTLPPAQEGRVGRVNVVDARQSNVYINPRFIKVIKAVVIGLKMKLYLLSVKYSVSTL